MASRQGWGQAERMMRASIVVHPDRHLPGGEESPCTGAAVTKSLGRPTAIMTWWYFLRRRESIIPTASWTTTSGSNGVVPVPTSGVLIESRDRRRARGPCYKLPRQPVNASAVAGRAPGSRLMGASMDHAEGLLQDCCRLIV